ncbi:MAG TPA: SpoIIE family protein phosphatase [Flavobacteriales bacterium]
MISPIMPGLIDPNKLDRLVLACQELSRVRDMASVMEVVRRAAREITGADGATFVLRDHGADGDHCYYADEDAIGPLWKGARFPIGSCISGWAMIHSETVVIEDIYADERIPAELYQPTFVKSLVMVPIRKQHPLGAIGNYWQHQRQPDAEDIYLLESLADITAVTIELVESYNRLEHRVEERTKELQLRNEELTSNIQYAKRVQDAILPERAWMKELLPESFVMYRPKAIVSGDFYWMGQYQGEVMVAAADCTGHGVTGALLSAMCSNLLDRAVNEFGLTEPGMVLDKTRELLWERLARSAEMTDGMDISLCSIDPHSGSLRWSGALCDLIYVHQGRITEVKSHREAVGRARHRSRFPTHRLKLDKGDMVYLMTDGYVDQFGGPQGKKYKSRPMKQLLQGIHTLPVDQQQELLEVAFDEWKGDLEQVDDVTIVGFRI